MITNLPKIDFAKGIKSNIYVFADVFTPYKGKVMLLPPTEELVRARLQHEYKHAEDAYHGMNLDNNMKIDSSNILLVHPDAYSFVLETRGYMRAIEFAKKFGVNHSAYLRSINEFDIYLGNWQARNYSSNDFGAYDRELISHQCKQIEKIIPEIKRFRKIVEGINDYSK